MELGLVLSGQHERVYEGLATVLNPGEVWMCAMWEPHGWQAVLPDTTEVVLTFIPEFLGEEMFETVSWLALFAAPPARRPRLSTPQARRAVLAIGEELAFEIRDRPPAWRSVVRFNLLRLLALLYRQWDVATKSAVAVPSHSNKLARIMPALDMLHRRPGFRVGVREAAAACSFSSSQFRWIFCQTMGMNFAQFRLRARLGFVAHRLLTSDVPTDTIAEEAGFANASHLHHAFAKHYGCTPGQYREHPPSGGDGTGLSPPLLPAGLRQPRAEERRQTRARPSAERQE